MNNILFIMFQLNIKIYYIKYIYIRILCYNRHLGFMYLL